jgi:formylglycine-generating enzyme required for sulfatase activity
VAVSVAALNLQGVGDVVWDIEVVNGADPAEVVWQRRLSSSGYGDGAGSASYVGPCDADPAVADNTVRVWVVGVYAAPVTTLGSFASGAEAGVAGAPMDFQNPTTVGGPLTRGVTCQQNADVAVQFDVALMRPAQQGFFDIAVNFNNIFCSAKFDCCDDSDGTAGCATDGSEDITLLFEPGGARGPTMVLGFACTAAVGTDVATVLYLDALELDCTAPTDFGAGFEADVVIDPAGSAGNQCVAGEVGGDECAAVTSPTSADADTYLYQIGVYRGVEQLTSGGVLAQKVYWNVALGVKPKVDAGAGIEDCWLRTRGTAHDGSGTSVVDGGVIAPGAVYPFVTWEVALGTCGAEVLTFGDATTMVKPGYSTTAEAEPAFGFEYGTDTPAAPVTPPCGGLDPCPLGFTFTLSGTWENYTTGEVYVPETLFWMGCDHTVAAFQCAEWDAHWVWLDGFAIGKTEVPWEAYKAWCDSADPATCTPSHSFTTTAYGTARVDATSLNPAKAGHPVNYVSWVQAQQYCFAQGGDLCTEAQWELAAGGGGAQKYPWGNTEPSGCVEANWSGCTPVDDAGNPTVTEAVTSHPAGASPYGALNMGGNVYELTRDWLTGSFPAPPAISINPTGAATGTNKVVKGGAYNAGTEMRVFNRVITTPTHAGSGGGGFRCCR